MIFMKLCCRNRMIEVLFTNRLLHVSLFITFWGPVYGQGWEKIFYRPGSDLFPEREVMVTPDGGLLINFHEKWDNNAFVRAVFIKLDQEGRVQWESIMDSTVVRVVEMKSTGEAVIHGEKKGAFFIGSVQVDGQICRREKFDTPSGWGGVRASRNGDYYYFDNIEYEPEKWKGYVFKIDSLGSPLWEWEDASGCQNFILRLYPDEDEGLFIDHVSYADSLKSEREGHLTKLDRDGRLEWTIDLPERLWGVDFDSLRNQLFLLNGGTAVTRIDRRGEILEEGAIMSASLPRGNHFIRIIPEEDHVFLGGHTGHGNVNSGYLTLMKTDLGGNIEYENYFGFQTANQSLANIVQTPDGGVVLLGDTNVRRKISNQPFLDDIYLVKTDRAGRSITNYIKGTFLIDVNDDCVPDPMQRGLEGWIVKISNESDLYYGITDSNGAFLVRTDTGSYRVDVVLPNAYWGSCQKSKEVVMSIQGDTAEVDFTMQPVYDCPLLKVDVSTPLLRRCYENTYTVRYCNEGTAQAEGTFVTVTVDSLLQINSSQPSWDTRNGQQLQYFIGNVPVGACADIRIDVTVDCERTQLGQSHCVEARIFPDSLCTPPGINWDGSSLEVSGQCLGDSVQFRIQNVGLDMTEPSTFIVIENDVIYLGGTVQLPAGEEELITTYASGKTFGLSAKQPDGHPGSSNPSVFVEGCAAEGEGMDFGFATQNPFDEGDPFVAIDCQENIGSWDPNDIRGFPTGVGAKHWIDGNIDLEYKIRFQNTGTDTAFNVFIRDTLPPELDVATFVPGASSHPYECEVINGNVLKFTFSNIMLPDSNVNEAASHGFIQYKIRQGQGLTPGTTIRNRAGIYFDFNAPVLTNTALHTIRKPVRFGVVENRHSCSFQVQNPIFSMGVDSLLFTEYDSLVLWSGMIFPSQEVRTDTVVFSDTSLYVTDTILLFYYTNQYGCDSIVESPIVVGTEQVSILGNLVKIYPNPSSGQDVELAFSLRQEAEVTIDLLDVTGRIIGKILSNKRMPTGIHEIRFSPTQLTAGFFFVRIRAGSVVRTQRLLLLDG